MEEVRTMKRASKTPDNKYVIKFRAENRTLTPQPSRGLDFPFDRNSKPDIEAEILRVEGNAEGKYYMPDRQSDDGTNYHLAVLPDLKQHKKSLQDQFERYQRNEVAQGNRKPESRPPDLEDPWLIVCARIQVAEEELALLKELLAPLADAEEKEETGILPRKYWKTGKLDQDGILKSLGGMSISRSDPEDPDSILIINDDRSPFTGMPVWRFKSQVLMAIDREISWRKRQEKKLAIKENRAPQPIKHVPTPIYHSENQSIEYPGYSDTVLKKIKQL